MSDGSAPLPLLQLRQPASSILRIKRLILSAWHQRSDPPPTPPSSLAPTPLTSEPETMSQSLRGSTNEAQASTSSSSRNAVKPPSGRRAYVTRRGNPRLPHPHPHRIAQQHHGTLEHPTMRLIQSRLQQGSMPGQRTDGFKLGLVVEGGGMRGCISGAMLSEWRATLREYSCHHHHYHHRYH